jgi:uncharacterized protein YdeI (YjbR/CyaY-like superfamily)
MLDPADLLAPVSPAKQRQLFYHFKLHGRSDAAAKLAVGLVAPLYSYIGILQAKKEISCLEAIASQADKDSGYESMNTMTPQVDGYIRKHKKWQNELQKLRTIVLDCPLAEEIKWRVPCYTSERRNIVFLGAFKEYCALSFVKGVLLKDPHRMLKKPGENTQSSRLVRFTDVQQIVELEPVLKAYIREAIEVEKAGLKVKLKKIAEFKVPEEFQSKLDELPALKTAFHALTPGRQRAYLLYFSGARQSKTRASRVDKCMPQILKGKGLDDR